MESRKEPTEFNRDDLASLVESENVAVDSEDEEDIRLFQNALDFADLRVRDCMEAASAARPISPPSASISYTR